MTASLLDVNMLLALSWPWHKSHGIAQKWFGRFEAIEALGVTTGHPSHQFWPDDISLARGLANWRDRIRGHQQITDAYLLALTIHHHGKLATLDKLLMALVDGGSSAERSHLELID